MTKLYRLMSPEYAMENLRNGVLHLCRFEKLNDPYEGMPTVQDENNDHAHPELIRKHVKKMLSRSGLICLTENIKSPSMWGYYAESHKGIALEFSFHDCPKQSKFRKVLYPVDDKRVPLPLDFEKMNDEERQAFYESLLFTKSKSWDHEEEYRRLVPLRNCYVTTDYKGNFFIPFIRELSGVVLGVDCKIPEMDFHKWQCEYGYPDIPIYRAEMDHATFDVRIPEKPLRF